MSQSPTQIARSILSTADALGWDVHVRRNILSITKCFAPGDMDAFVEADGQYYDIISQLPRTSAGSDWGTDGGGMGGVAAHRSGVFTYNRSGGAKRVLRALEKLL